MLPKAFRTPPSVQRAEKRLTSLKDEQDDEKHPAKHQKTESAFERRLAIVQHIIRLILARLNEQQPPKVPSLADLASKALASQLPKLLGDDTKSKRSWQFASVGLLPPPGNPPPQVSGGMEGGPVAVSGMGGTVVFASNNMANLKGTPPHLSPMKKMTDVGREKRKKIGPRVYHTETRQLAEGCRHVAVTGGLNCIFCALYRRHRGVPYAYHTNPVASWHLPENLSIEQFFGNAIRDYVNGHEFKSEFGPMTTQGLIDLLCNSTQMWP